MKKFLLFIGLIVGGVWFYGSRLPREHTARSSIVLVSPVDTVFKAVRNIGKQPTWWSDAKSVRALLDIGTVKANAHLPIAQPAPTGGCGGVGSLFIGALTPRQSVDIFPVRLRTA